MDDLYNLELLSLVAKITQEIDNHTGLNDKTLAEFVINLHEQSKSLSEFKQKLKDMEADFPDSFVDNMDRLIVNMHPKHKKRATTAGSTGIIVVSEEPKTKRTFPGHSEDQPSVKRPRKHVPLSPPPSPSPPRGRSPSAVRDRANGYRRSPLDDRPVLFKIYDGKVASLKDFGAFVQLQGVARRVEGEFRSVL